MQFVNECLPPVSERELPVYFLRCLSSTLGFDLRSRSQRQFRQTLLAARTLALQQCRPAIVCCGTGVAAPEFTGSLKVALQALQSYSCRYCTTFRVFSRLRFAGQSCAVDDPHLRSIPVPESLPTYISVSRPNRAPIHTCDIAPNVHLPTAAAVHARVCTTAYLVPCTCVPTSYLYSKAKNNIYSVYIIIHFLLLHLPHPPLLRCRLEMKN